MMLTVLMPVFNGGIYLKDSIQSILDQTFSNFELLIINDGSTDDSVATIKSIDDSRIRLIDNQQNQGLIATLNAGLALAKGKYIARQDADDISLPTRFEREIAILEADPDIALVGTNAIIIDKNSKPVGKSTLPSDDVEIRFRLLFKCGIFHTSVIFRKAVLDAHQLSYRADYIHVEDYKLWSEISRYGKLHMIADNLIHYRAHASSISSRFKKQQEMNAALVAQENISQLNINLSVEKAERLRNHFRTIKTTSDFIEEDISTFLEIIARFEQKYNHEAAAKKQPAKLMQRMTRWIAKKDLYQWNLLKLYLALHCKLLINYNKLFDKEIQENLNDLQ